MATATKTKPKNKTKKSQFTPYTEAEITTIREEVAKAPNVKMGLVTAAKKLGKNEGAVRQKWYSMSKAARGGKVAKVVKQPKAATRSAKPVMQTAPVEHNGWIQSHIDTIDSKIMALQDERSAFALVQSKAPKHA